MPTRNNTRPALTTSCSVAARRCACELLSVLFETGLKFSKQNTTSVSGSVQTLNKQNQVNNGMNFIYLKQYFSPFLTFLKLKTAKNKSSALLSCR